MPARHRRSEAMQRLGVGWIAENSLTSKAAIDAPYCTQTDHNSTVAARRSN